MNLDITFRNCEPNEVVKLRAEKKLAKIAKHLRPPIDAHLVFKSERHTINAEVTVVGGGDGQRFSVHETTEDVNSAVDRVMEKLETVVRRARERELDRHSDHTTEEVDGFNAEV